MHAEEDKTKRYRVLAHYPLLGLAGLPSICDCQGDWACYSCANSLRAQRRTCSCGAYPRCTASNVTSSSGSAVSATRAGGHG